MSNNNSNNDSNNIDNDDDAGGMRIDLPSQKALGIAHNTEQRRGTGLMYINMYMNEMKPFGDDDIMSFQALTAPYVAGDNLQKFMHGFYVWFANKRLRTSQNTWLSTEMKSQYQKSAKQVIKAKFPTHHLFSVEYNDWHEDILRQFKTECTRSRQLDENIVKQRKSEPLYRNISENFTAIRAKYRGENNVYDCRTISMNMLKNVDDLNSASVLSEFNTNRAATGRGGEHALLQWDEGTYDPFYCAPDFDWPILKQLERQCMFFFCDLLLYMLCPFFGWGVYFLFGGLRRDDTGMGTAQIFVYPHLQALKRNSVAHRMTKKIRAAIGDEARKRSYTSRSMRKGQMGVARMNHDLYLTEEYAHSGHHHPSMNSNAEGYIESNPAITAPGALAVAGYTNCHMRPSPFGFHALGEEVIDIVKKLVSELFINDIPRLQEGRNLHPIIMICAACLIGSYNDLIRDLGVDHKVVKLIMAARRAKLDDVCVTGQGTHRYHLVLKDWSRKISKTFKEENDQVSPDDPKVNEELLRQLLQWVNRLEASLAEHIDLNRSLQTAYEQITIQKGEMASQANTIKRQQMHIRTLTKMLEAAQHLFPGSSNSPVHHLSQQTGVEASSSTSSKRPAPPNIPEIDPTTTTKKLKSATHLNSVTPAISTTTMENGLKTAAISLDGVQDISATTNVSGITVSAELERLWKTKVLVNKSQELEGDDPVLSKEVLFKRIHTGVHCHPAFRQSSKMAKYDAGMTFVAVGISDDDWKKMCKGELDDSASRELFKKIERDTMCTAIEWEKQLGETAKEKSKATVHSLGGRFKSLKRYQTSNDKTFDMDAYVEHKLGAQKLTQKSLLSLFGTGAGTKKS